MRKIGQWYPEEHTVEEIYLKENIVMDEDCHEYGIHDVYWDYEEALSHAAELNAEKKHERRSEATKKNLLKLIEEYRVKAQGYCSFLHKRRRRYTIRLLVLPNRNRTALYS